MILTKRNEIWMKSEIGVMVMKTWKEARVALYTAEEIRESNLRVAIIGELIKARREQNISQRQLEELSGVKQPIISRMESGETNPQLDTVLKVLAPLGKTLAVVPLSEIALPRDAATI